MIRRRKNYVGFVLLVKNVKSYLVGNYDNDDVGKDEKMMII